ncbi:MAG: rfbC [Candidatus Eremiobacteraeota bacterium]|nr:rfbC [Candidatus Eremiobacteraeota bacterium]
MPLAVAGAFALEPEPVRDERGWFARWWDAEQLAAAHLTAHFVQQSAAWNERAGTLRGLHVVLPPASEAKIVRCVRGKAFDVVLDARPSSATFGRHVSLDLSERNGRAVYVPAGCAHGYQTLEDDTTLLYDISSIYRPELACGIAHDDAALGIEWPLPVEALSARDAALPLFAKYVAQLPAEVQP